VINRTQERAESVIASIGVGRAGELLGITAAVAEADIVVTSTGASHFILTPENVAEAMRTRPDRPLFIVDIAVPRDVDPDVATIDGVRVVDVDGLRGVIDVTLEHRREAIPLVEEIIAEHTERFAQWYQARVAVPVISSLVQRAETIRENELERLFARCPELTDRERMLITGTSLKTRRSRTHRSSRSSSTSKCRRCRKKPDYASSRSNVAM
jgi:glutamyl-tRNA reductase